MQDIEALCDRVMIINHGRLIHDGPLAGVIHRFAGYKILKLRFRDGRLPEGLEEIGEVLEAAPPKIALRLPQASVAKHVARLLADSDIDDISVVDPPIEDVISQAFGQAPVGDTDAGAAGGSSRA